MALSLSCLLCVYECVVLRSREDETRDVFGGHECVVGTGMGAPARGVSPDRAKELRSVSRGHQY